MEIALQDIRSNILLEGCSQNGDQITVAKFASDTGLDSTKYQQAEPLNIVTAGSNNSNESNGMFKVSAAKESVDIYFDNISYSVKLGFRKGIKKILHGVNGRFLPGQMTAIMGPSGAGKSTLLDCLSAYRISGVQGAVYVNGRGRELNLFKRMSCYIMQEDRLQPLLTVQESMEIAADLKLNVKVPYYEKAEIIEEILTTLGLYEHQNTRAGQLSGGQKKRLSIALELINNPLVMFLDEPTTGLDSASCKQVVSLLKLLAQQGRTIICTIHQPPASLFQVFDQVYVLAQGECLYQGSTSNLVPYLESHNKPCPKYHNPADFIIEIASAEFGEEIMKQLVDGMQNGKCLDWFDNRARICDLKTLRSKYPLSKMARVSNSSTLEETPESNQLKVLMRRGFLKTKRDSTLTHLRIMVNAFTGIMLGLLFWNTGNEGSRVIDNYNLLFAILIHHNMTTKMLTILTFPMEMSILLKEHFNRWYSLKSYYIALTIVDLPITIFCCLLFTVIIYFMSGQPMEFFRLAMFFTISLLVVLVAHSFGLMIGAVCNVVNGTFLGPTLSVPVMMFAGFGVTLRDLPVYLKWGSYVSYLRYGLEGYVGSIYGEDRPTLECPEGYCHYKYPEKFLMEITMQGDQFWNDVLALSITILIMRIIAYFMLKWKLTAVR